MDTMRRIIGIVVMAIMIPAAQAQADLDSGPYLLNITQTSLEVVYEGDDSDDPGTVHYGPTQALGFSENAQRRPSHDEMFTATLSGLAPASVYYYQVDHEGETSPLGSFITPVVSGDPFTFVVMGDTRSGHDHHQDIVDSILDNGIPDLLFNTGDLVEEGGKKDQWQTFFEIEEDLLRNCIFGPVFGNHEIGFPALFPEFFTTGNTYSYQFGNAVFIVLNTESPHGPASEQTGFLEAALQAAQGDPGIDFKFVFFHRPGMTTSEKHAPDSWVLKAFFDLFEEYGVHAVYTGHNHLYEHGIINGVHHIVSGGGGASRYDYIEDYEPEGWTIVHREKTYHFLEVSVEADQYTSVAMRADLSVMDTYTSTAAGGGFPGPIPGDLLNRANPFGCTQVEPAGADMSSLLNLIILLMPAIVIRLKKTKGS